MERKTDVIYHREMLDSLDRVWQVLNDTLDERDRRECPHTDPMIQQEYAVWHAAAKLLRELNYLDRLYAKEKEQCSLL